MAFTLKINGTPHKVDVDGDTPLLWVLRDVLGMNGTKFGCGQALRGACGARGRRSSAFVREGERFCPSVATFLPARVLETWPALC